MTEKKKNAVESQPAADAADSPTWKPTPEAKKQATTFRWIAVTLWVLAIAGEAVGIFWLLRQRVVIGEEGTFRRDTETGLLTGGVETQFPQWAFITLIVLLVVIAALSIIGSLLWKKANRLDPARKSDTLRFFVQNQLGAIIAIIAFLPLVILIFLNKDMDKGQKTTAGIIGVVLAAVAVFFGIDFKPSSVEQYDADQSTVIQLLGKDQVVWVDGGKVYHVCDQVPDIQTGSDKRTGTSAEAVAAGKLRLTLRFVSEMKTCGLTVPENADEITAALREIQDGKTGIALPSPVWGDSAQPPVVVKDTAAN